MTDLHLTPDLTIALGEVQPAPHALTLIQGGVSLGQVLSLKDAVSQQEVDLLMPLVAKQGEPGVWDAGDVLLLKQMTLTSVAGVLTVPLNRANTFLVPMHESITSVVFQDPPFPGVSARVQLYFDQPVSGGFTLSGWPSNVFPAEQIPPVLNSASKMRTNLVLDTFDGAASVQLNLVASYGPIP